MSKLMTLATWLGSRRDQPRRWLFVLASLPIVLFGLMGAEYGVLPFYLAIAAVFLYQVFYPTLIVWFSVTLVYCVMVVAYVGQLIADLFSLLRGTRPSLFTDPDDSLFFGLLLAYMFALTMGLLFSRPTPQKNP